MGWRAAGRFFGGNNYASFGVWRERSSGRGTYDRVATVELGTCGSGVRATPVTGLSDVYECTLPGHLRVSVQPGDVVGIEAPGRDNLGFGVLFDNSNGAAMPLQYVFNGSVSTITLSESSNTSPGDQPQISLRVEVATPTTEAPTTTEVPVSPTTGVAITTQPPTEVVTSTQAVTSSSTNASTTVAMATGDPTSSTSEEPTITSAPVRRTVVTGLIIGVVAGGGTVIAVFSVAIVALVYIVIRSTKLSSTKVSSGRPSVHKDKDGPNDETEEMEYNGAYITNKFRTKDNVAYGLSSVNAVVYYETIGEPASLEASTSIEPSIYSTIS